MTITYLNSFGQEVADGSIIRINSTLESGNQYVYTVNSMFINFGGHITIEGVIELTTPDSAKIYKEAFSLGVTNNTFRKLPELAVHNKEEAYENNVLKTGYIGEFDLFVQMFGHNTFNTVNAIYPFIVDAIQRKYNLN